jgi:hypothetical protein
MSAASRALTAASTLIIKTAVFTLLTHGVDHPHIALNHRVRIKRRHGLWGRIISI